MRFMLSMACDGVAFGDWPGLEVSRILQTVAGRVAEIVTIDADSGTLRDINGNTVGRWQFIDDGEGE